MYYTSLLRQWHLIIILVKTDHLCLRVRCHKCSECHEFGHTTKYCQGGPIASQKKRRLSSTQGEESRAGRTSK
jgi:hypothetical protein